MTRGTTSEPEGVYSSGHTTGEGKSRARRATEYEKIIKLLLVWYLGSAYAETR